MTSVDQLCLHMLHQIWHQWKCRIANLQEYGFSLVCWCIYSIKRNVCTEEEPCILQISLKCVYSYGILNLTLLNSFVNCTRICLLSNVYSCVTLFLYKRELTHENVYAQLSNDDNSMCPLFLMERKGYCFLAFKVKIMTDFYVCEDFMYSQIICKLLL